MDPTRGVGLLWEIALSHAFAVDQSPLDERVGEIVKDGIIMTPDGFDFNNWWVVESKATWRSSNADITDAKFWDYITQIKAYCWAMESYQAKLQVLFINGDYRQSGPQYRVWLLTFQKHELVENWKMCTNHRDKMLKEGWGNGQKM